MRVVGESVPSGIVCGCPVVVGGGWVVLDEFSIMGDVTEDILL